MSKIEYKKKNIAELILLAQSGDIKALEEIIRKKQNSIYTIFSHLVYKKEDVSDLTQDVLLKMAKSLNQLKDPNNFKSWLNQITTNVFNDYARKKQADFVEIEEEKLSEIKDRLACEPGQRCIFSELEKLVRSALLSLPQKLRITIVLREYEGLSYEEISQITDATLGTVKSRLSRARLKLQKTLKDFI